MVRTSRSSLRAEHLLEESPSESHVASWCGAVGDIVPGTAREVEAVVVASTTLVNHGDGHCLAGLWKGGGDLLAAIWVVVGVGADLSGLVQVMTNSHNVVGLHVGDAAGAYRVILSA